MNRYEDLGKADALWFCLDGQLSVDDKRELAAWYRRAAERSTCAEVQTYCRGYASVMARAADDSCACSIRVPGEVD